MASELLKVSHTAGVTNSESVLINGVSGHTYTILSIFITETAGAAETVDLYIDDGGGGTDYEVLSDQALDRIRQGRDVARREDRDLLGTETKRREPAAHDEVHGVVVSHQRLHPPDRGGGDGCGA